MEYNTVVSYDSINSINTIIALICLRGHGITHRVDPFGGRVYLDYSIATKKRRLRCFHMDSFKRLPAYSVSVQ